jgi:putative nucleotidyltransferase with HDIG domain
MISLKTRNLQEGMITAQGIYNAGGASYLTKGMPLKQQYINRLEQLGINYVAVTSSDPEIKLPPPKDIIQEKTRITAIHRVFSAFQNAEDLNEQTMAPLQTSAESIVLDLLSRHENLVQMTDIRLHDEYTFAHSVNVSILSSMLGWLCGMDHHELLLLSLGGLLHDLGKIDVPENILNKPAPLTNEEFTIMKKHTLYGAKRISSLHIPQTATIAAIASQHHEHIDGNGYPFHLKDSQIRMFARITAIADVYDALTSERVYKHAYKPHMAYQIMTQFSEGQFDLDLLHLFFKNVALYPVGTVLNTIFGYAIVKDVKPGQTKSPFICVFADEKQDLLESPRLLKLADYPPNVIKNVLDDQELLTLTYHIHVDPSRFLTDDI